MKLSQGPYVSKNVIFILRYYGMLAYFSIVFKRFRLTPFTLIRNFKMTRSKPISIENEKSTEMSRRLAAHLIHFGVRLCISRRPLKIDGICRVWFSSVGTKCSTNTMPLLLLLGF